MQVEKGQVRIVVGGQYGSECKGAVAARLHRDNPNMAGVRVGGSQAGHSVVDDKGVKWALRHIPVAAVIDPICPLIIAAGSEIDLEVLNQEVRDLENAGYNILDRLLIDREATVIEAEHKEQEKILTKGTTAKGVGAARAARAMRQAARMGDLMAPGFDLIDTVDFMHQGLNYGAKLLIEGVQGYGLGTHAGAYPHCTSSDCRAIDFMAMAGLPPVEAEVWVVLRTHPIRIAGNSGEMKDETSWAELGLDEEITTVTKKIRRVGGWDKELARTAVAANGGQDVKAALMTADYEFPGIEGANGPRQMHMLPGEVVARMAEIEKEIGTKIWMLGTGPASQLRIERTEG